MASRFRFTVFVPPDRAMNRFRYQWQLARDAVATIQGTAETPVLAGSLALADGPTGSMQFNYEMYSNTYLVFVLLTPTRRFTFRPAVNAQWRPSAANPLAAEITG